MTSTEAATIIESVLFNGTPSPYTREVAHAFALAVVVLRGLRGQQFDVGHKGDSRYYAFHEVVVSNDQSQDYQRFIFNTKETP